MDCFVTKYDPLVAIRFLIYYNKNLVMESVAQLAEQWTVDPRVAGSTPVEKSITIRTGEVEL